MMKPTDVVPVLLLALYVLTKPVAGAEHTYASDLDLRDGIEAALQRDSGFEIKRNEFRASRWLASVPSISLSQINSRDDLGSDETEIALNLPFKSPARARADGRLRELDFALQTARNDIRRLYFSGLLREAWWSYRLASLEFEGARSRIELLAGLVEQQQAVTAAGGLPGYAVLVVRRELLAARAEAAALESDLERWRSRYESITGLQPPHAEVVQRDDEEDNVAAPWRIAEHPAVRLLELEWQRQQAVLSANTSVADDWTLSATGRRLDTPGFSEQQFGLSLEIPLSFLPVASQTDRSEWHAGAGAYLRSRDELLVDLQHRTSALRAEQEALQARLELLRETVGLDEKLARQLSALSASNSIESELLLRRRLDIQSARLQLRLTEARLAENCALLRQAHGESL
jgi:hypothetical protein